MGLGDVFEFVLTVVEITVGVGDLTHTVIDNDIKTGSNDKTLAVNFETTDLQCPKCHHLGSYPIQHAIIEKAKMNSDASVINTCRLCQTTFKTEIKPKKPLNL